MVRKVLSLNYFTIKDFAKASFVEKNSEFIGHVCPVSCNDEAVEFIEAVKAEHRKARHNVYAYITRDNNITRYSDDGEPQGTGGVPVLEVMKKNNLTDICCVVTRYFGGILLGGGGLVRAYSHAAKIAIDAAVILDMSECRRVTINTDYNMYGKINYCLPEFHVKIINSEFNEYVKIELFVKLEFFDSLIKKITDISNGTANIIAMETVLFEDFAGIV